MSETGEQSNVWERRPKPDVQAVRWTGENLEQVREVFPGIGEEYMRDKGCYPGCYVICPRAGRVYFMGQCAFEEEFQRPALASRATGELPERPDTDFAYDSGRFGSRYEEAYRASTANAHFEALEAQIAELRAQVEQKDAEIVKLKSRREHTQKWYASHYAKLHDWARNRLPDPWRNEHFSCVANGTWGTADRGERYMAAGGFEVVPSGYIHMDDAKGILVIEQTARAEEAEEHAEKAEQALATAREEIALGRKKYNSYRDGMIEAQQEAEESGIRKALEAVTSCKYNYPEYGPCFGNTFEHGRKEAISLIAALLSSAESASKEGE